MSISRFFDTNILVYAYDVDAPEKRAVALRLVEQAWRSPGTTSVSVQVIQEFHVNLEKHGVPRAEAAQLIQDYARWPVVDNTLALLLAAVELQARWHLSLWDATILAAARASGASELLTEDFNHGQDYGGVRAINPFR